MNAHFREQFMRLLTIGTRERRVDEGMPSHVAALIQERDALLAENDQLRTALKAAEDLAASLRREDSTPSSD
jgi:hypothetical protein